MSAIELFEVGKSWGNSVNSRPLTVGLQIFSSIDQGIDWSIITAATLLSSAPLLSAFLLSATSICSKL